MHKDYLLKAQTNMLIPIQFLKIISASNSSLQHLLVKCYVWLSKFKRRAYGEVFLNSVIRQSQKF